ncbi:MAG: TolC family protein [Flavobacteriales bacterium]|nr:TolC family protein [Flavobacteriales bacterium]MCB9175194.1 TolC family protein [Flavobacteriales bacterium]
MTLKIRLASLFLIFHIVISAQDSIKIFSIDQYLWFVSNYHPIVKQGQLLIKQGESTVLQSRGAFDPYLYGGVDQKQFNDKDYYSIIGGGLKVPTWYGVELKTSINQNRGIFLNPENNTPPSGLLNAGISIPLGQGLFIDKRRATLKQAQIFNSSSKYEQQLIINDLYYEAISQYWNWVESWNNYQLLEESIKLAEERFEAVKSSFIMGDKPAIDTVEAFLILQNRMLDRNQYGLVFNNNTLELSNYLWYENNIPLVITDSLRPPIYSQSETFSIITADSVQNILNSLNELHPELLLYNNKLSSLNIDKRLKQEGLKPKINVNYNFLNSNFGDNIFNTFSSQNYKWGVEVSFPIFIRQQRGDLQLAKIKIQDVDFSMQQKTLEIQNNVKQQFNEQLTLNEQVKLSNSMVENYTKLLLGEKQNFFEGESSLFLVNSREQKLIESQLKLIELKTKLYNSSNKFYWSAGLLPNIY